MTVASLVQISHVPKYEMHIFVIVSVITICLVITFNLGKDSDTIEYETFCANDTITYSIPKICNEIYSNMYAYCQYGSIYSEILLWGLFSTYCVQTKQLQIIFPIIIAIMTLSCIIWNIALVIKISINNCYDIINSYDYLSMEMFICNAVILYGIFICSVIIAIIHIYKKKIVAYDATSEMDELN